VYDALLKYSEVVAVEQLVEPLPLCDLPASHCVSVPHLPDSRVVPDEAERVSGRSGSPATNYAT
jgi:hypothetical protein